jgi:hypothetical protein
LRLLIGYKSQLCAYTKNVLFSSSALLEQRFLQFISKVLINCKDRWSYKTELENRTFFVYAHNCDSGFMRTRDPHRLRYLFLVKKNLVYSLKSLYLILFCKRVKCYNTQKNVYNTQKLLPECSFLEIF